MTYKTIALTGAAFAALVAPTNASWAQVATPPADGDADIVVTGIRGSLERAAELKRNADQVLDVITAEDVGKLPDANVAEALQRITGVQITRVFGEGQSVSIRGLQQVRVEVDGRTLLGFSARLSPPENEQLGRSSGLDSVPSGLFGRLEVRKSPLASQVEGGLGGVVTLVTPKPFDFKEPRISVRLQGTYSDNSEEFEPGATGLVTTQFADGKVGVLLSAEYQKRTSVIQAFERNNFLNRNFTSGTPPVTAVRQTPVLLQYENFVVDRSRLGVQGAVQLRISPDFVITAEGLYSALETGRRQDFLSFRLPTGANPVANAVIVDNFVVAGTANGTVQTAGQLREEPTRSYLAALNGKYDDGRVTVEADGYYSRGTIDQTIQIITLQGAAAIPGSFDFRAGTIPILTLGTTAAPFDATNFANFNPLNNGVRSNRLIGLLEEYAGRVDFSYRFDGGLVVQAGARYVDLRSRSNAFRSQTTRPRTEIQPFTALTTASFNPDIPGTFPRLFLTTRPTRDYVFTTAQAAQPNPDPSAQSTLLPNIQRDYDLQEKTFAAFVMVSADGELFGRPVKANAGMRVANTDLSVDSFRQRTVGAVTTFVPETASNSYTNWLPSANVVMNVTDNFLARFSASRTMQRAGIAELAPSTFFNQTNLSVSGGNAELKPAISNQLDLSFEYYTGRSSLISGAIFYKSVKDFIASATVQAVFPGEEQFGPIPTTRPFNIASAKIRGFEIGVQQFLDFLPSPLDGLGFIANYTYSDAEDDRGFPLVAVSKNSFNLIGLYEKGPLSARIAYNFRDEAVFEFSEGRPSFVGSLSQLDAQLGFDLSKTFQLQLQAQNLLPRKAAVSEYSSLGPVALNSYALSERRFTIGVRGRF